MSRTGKKPVAPVSGVTVSVNGQTVTAKGPKGEMSVVLMDLTRAELTAHGVVVIHPRRTDYAELSTGIPHRTGPRKAQENEAAPEPKASQ